MSRLYQLVTVIAVVALCQPVHAAPAGLDDEEAAAHFARGQDLFDQEKYAEAVPELKAAYALDPKPSLLYAWAQAERLGGNCAKAVGLYKRFLETNPSEKSAALTKANIVDCEAELGPPPPPPMGQVGQPSDESEQDPQPDPIGDEGPRPDDRPWHRDWVAGVLLGTGTAAAVAGGVVLGISYQQVGNSPDAATEGDYFDEVDGAKRLNVAGWAVLGVGAALLIGGAARLAVLGIRHKKRKSSARVLMGPGGATLRVRF